MYRTRGILLIVLLGLVAATPAMAFDLKIGVNLGLGKHCDRPVVVRERVHTPPVIVEKPCHPVFIPRPCVKVVHVAPHRHWTKSDVVRPHATRVIIRTRR